MSNQNMIFYFSIFLIILLSVLITIMILKSNYYNKLAVQLNLIEKENKFLNKQIFEEKERLFKISEEYYNKGLKEGLKRNNFTIRVDPIENNTGKDYWIYSSEKIEIGYKYTLVNNDIPSEFTTTHFTKVISKSRIKEENINEVLNTINQIQNLNPSTFIINDGFESIKKRLLQQLLKK